MKIGKYIIMFLLTSMWLVSSCDNGPKREIWLEEIYRDSCFVQDWGIPQINQSVVWTPLKVNGVTYEHGIGAHCSSRLSVIKRNCGKAV